MNTERYVNIDFYDIPLFVTLTKWEDAWLPASISPRNHTFNMLPLLSDEAIEQITAAAVIRSFEEETEEP